MENGERESFRLVENGVGHPIDLKEKKRCEDELKEHAQATHKKNYADMKRKDDKLKEAARKVEEKLKEAAKKPAPKHSSEGSSSKRLAESSTKRGTAKEPAKSSSSTKHGISLSQLKEDDLFTDQQTKAQTGSLNTNKGKDGANRIKKSGRGNKMDKPTQQKRKR